MHYCTEEKIATQQVSQTDEVATSQILVNLCVGITQLENQLRKPSYINMTTDLMLSEAFLRLL